MEYGAMRWTVPCDHTLTGSIDDNHGYKVSDAAESRKVVDVTDAADVVMSEKLFALRSLLIMV